MKAKQLEVIRSRHKAFLFAGREEKPDNCGCAIKLALVSDTPPKLKTRDEIIAAAKKVIVCNSSYRDTQLQLSDVFVTPPNSKLAAWEKSEAERQKRSDAYAKEAERLLTHAELHDDSDADDVLDRLTALAKKHGLSS